MSVNRSELLAVAVQDVQEDSDEGLVVNAPRFVAKSRTQPPDNVQLPFPETGTVDLDRPCGVEFRVRGQVNHSPA